jgi:hypothetical protein
MVGRLMERLFGGHFVQIWHPRHLTGNFNAHLMDALFVFADEAFWAGDRQGEGVLKGLITEPTKMVEPKGVDAFSVPNRVKLLIASNHDWVVPATADERRFFVLDVSEARIGDRNFFVELVDAIYSEEAGAFLHHLLQLDLDSFQIRDVPITAALDEQKLVGADSLTRFWFACLRSGTILNTTFAEWPKIVSKETFRRAYFDYAHSIGDRYPIGEAQLTKALGKLWPEKKVSTVRPRGGEEGDRERHYVLRSLDEHRAAFLSGMNIVADGFSWGDEQLEH